jgi:hypothetical protein
VGCPDGGPEMTLVTTVTRVGSLPLDVGNCHVSVSLYDSFRGYAETNPPKSPLSPSPTQPRYGHPRLGALTETELAAARADLAAQTKAAP